MNYLPNVSRYDFLFFLIATSIKSIAEITFFISVFNFSSISLNSIPNFYCQYRTITVVCFKLEKAVIHCFYALLVLLHNITLHYLLVKACNHTSSNDQTCDQKH